jgi:uncharacterized membrane protein HdeD (DUF308 family)
LPPRARWLTPGSARRSGQQDGLWLARIVEGLKNAQGFEPPLIAKLRHELNALRGNWFWSVFLGIALTVLGVVALGYVMIALLAPALAIGTPCSTRGGTAEALGAFWCRSWSGFFLHLLPAVLSIVAGVLLLRAPGGALAALTLLVACFLMAGGIFKIVAAARYRFATASVQTCDRTFVTVNLGRGRCGIQ